MTFFIKLVDNTPTGTPIVEQNFRQLFPNTSFPKYFTADVVEPLGYGLYDFRNQPVLGRYQKAVETTPVRSTEGIWCQTWEIVEMDDAEKTEVDVNVAEMTRLERNFRLQDSDWIVILNTEKGTDIPTAWATYRQALRDITAHANWPHLTEADWPVKPV